MGIVEQLQEEQKRNNELILQLMQKVDLLIQVSDVNRRKELDEEFLSIKEAAKLLNMAQSWFYQNKKAKEMGIKIGAKLMYRRSDLINFINSRAK